MCRLPRQRFSCAIKHRLGTPCRTHRFTINTNQYVIVRRSAPRFRGDRLCRRDRTCAKFNRACKTLLQMCLLPRQRFSCAIKHRLGTPCRTHRFKINTNQYVIVRRSAPRFRGDRLCRRDRTCAKFNRACKTLLQMCLLPRQRFSCAIKHRLGTPCRTHRFTMNTNQCMIVRRSALQARSHLCQI